jgi:Mrp family chromosome partitioning ATPase
LLGSLRTQQIMERLADYADLVIYDSPPAGVITDAVILAPRVDGVLQVVRAGRTRIDLIRRCKASLEQSGGKILGAVLNQVKLSEMGSYSYYYYYGYGDGDKAHRGGQRNGKLPHDDPPAQGA